MTAAEEQAVAAILRDEWDPIGLGKDGPRDEYDSYVRRVREVWRSGTNPHEAVGRVASYLTWIRIRRMGLAGWVPDKEAKAARLIHVALMEER